MDRLRSEDLVEILWRDHLDRESERCHRFDLQPHQRVLRRRQLDQLTFGIVEGSAHGVQTIEMHLVGRHRRRRPVGIALASLLRLRGWNFATLALCVAHLAAQRSIVSVAGGFVVGSVFCHAAL